jgi:hypothetical protein
MKIQELGEGNSPHKKGTKKYKKHMAAMHAGMSEELSQFDNERPENSEVTVQGIGRYSIETLKQSIQRQLSLLATQAERGDYDNIRYALDPNSIGGTLIPKVNALVKALDQLEAERKKGGARSGNIEPR